MYMYHFPVLVILNRRTGVGRRKYANELDIYSNNCVVYTDIHLENYCFKNQLFLEHTTLLSSVIIRQLYSVIYFLIIVI